MNANERDIKHEEFEITRHDIVTGHLTAHSITLYINGITVFIADVVSRFCFLAAFCIHVF